MTLNADSKEESKSDIASIDDTIDNSQVDEDGEQAMNEKESNPGNVEKSLDTDQVREESGETSPADESAAKEEKNEQAAVATADQKGANSDISLSSIRSKKKKQKIDPKNMIQTPNVHDVLLGRGKPFQNHDGNQTMLRIVDMYRKRYHESERAFKHEIIEEVLDIIKSKGGRFLERIDDFEKSFWNQVPHRMAYRKVGHAFRSNARRLSMEKRDLANNQRRNATAIAHASMMSQYNEGMVQRMPMQAMSFQEMMPMGGSLGLVDAMGIRGSSNSISSGMYRQGGGGLNQTQRELLAQEQMLHSSRIERILGGNNNGLNRAGDSVQSILGGVDSLPFAIGNGNIAERSLQINNMRRMMLLGSGGASSHPNLNQIPNSGSKSGSQVSSMGISNAGNIGGGPLFK